MKVGFTGTRAGLSEAQVAALRDLLEAYTPRPTDEAHHGDCQGADVAFATYAESLGMWTVAHPSENRWRAYTKSRTILPVKKEMDRNRDIVRVCDLLIACPENMEKRRSGTWATVRFARKMERPHTLIWPDGRIDPD